MDVAAASGREARSIVITGASRGLGLASAAHLYGLGWRVVGAMRSPAAGLERLRQATGARSDDPRLIGVRLDLQDPESIVAAARAIEEAVGPPDALVHNAGIAAVACAEGNATKAGSSQVPGRTPPPLAPRLSLILKSSRSISNSEMEFFRIRSMIALISFRSTMVSGVRGSTKTGDV